MKICVTCGIEKPDTEFNWRYAYKGIRHKICRECQNNHQRNWYESHKEIHKQNVAIYNHEYRKNSRDFVLEYLSTHPCSHCGESDPIVLEFHHLKGKDAEISRMVGQGVSIEKIKKEIEKCIVLCSNCHRKLTAKEQGWYGK